MKRWCSQPRFEYGQHLGDFNVCSAILVSGNNFSKVAVMFKAAGIQPPNQTLYTRVHGHYAAPAVSRYWVVVNQPILDRLSQQEDKVVLLGEYRTILSNILESK